ncbi:SGNH/GDSL hydrolase family protein [Gephyromycinifex aptenodytis]|uniref:SGNH/GDSL hydrolase family protein n=1 Tax=Gephyromycinifex aptenodytis TaxID=2716227 RepID=UPI00144875CD|nr:SGNH/GDSL hydrolase family protein [Gephyromycinifex aptenodytis]
MNPAGKLRTEASRLLAFALSPVLITQGGRVLASIPRLAEAGGPTHGQAPGQGEPIALLVVGESTAVGVGVDQHDEAIVGELTRLIAAQTGRAVRWNVIGRNGARLRATHTRALPEVIGEYDCCVVLLGVNDTLGLTSAGRWRKEMTTLLARLSQCTRAQGLIVLAGVPRLDRFPALPQPMRFVMGAHAHTLDSVLADLSDLSTAVAADPPVNTASAGDVSRVHVPTPPMEEPADLATDGFHPSAQGYQRWAQHLFAAAIHPWLQARTA